MELTVLVDNNTLTDRYLLGEPGLSLHLRDGDRDVLFDCGYSDVLCTNAGRLGLDLGRLSAVALSHGHLDHTWGLAPLLAFFLGRATEGHPLPRPRLVAHPEALAPRSVDGMPIGCHIAETALADYFQPTLTREPVKLTERLFFLGEIPRVFPFEATPPIGLRQTVAGPVPDDLPDDTALAYLGSSGLVVITGCAHSGICNIVEKARSVTGEKRLAAIVGGLHLLDAPPERLAETVHFLRAAGVADLYPGHCTDLAAKMALTQAARVHEVGVGLRLSFPGSEKAPPAAGRG